ncbi:MAG: HNH endonuclease [Magnetococcales bacterium]|nr:HNH endonuclease [Magnetococcales bacterium]|tara:strand:+ start:292987 stop:293631 length:645 start_codon:yes stop_codon:yes gene_type:complete
MTKRTSIPYSDAELAWIEKHKTLVRREAHKKFVKKFGRTDVSLKNYNALCKRKGWMTGRTGQFIKGQESHNKGKKMPYNPNSARHQFKKGNKPHNTKHAGHERISVDGYIEVSINETNPHTGFERRYVLKHRHLWEKQNGPIPEGMCLKSLDGNKLNTDPSNWELIDRGTLAVLNQRNAHNYNDAPAEVKPALLTLAKLKHRASQIEKDNKTDE